MLSTYVDVCLIVKKNYPCEELHSKHSSPASAGPTRETTRWSSPIYQSRDVRIQASWDRSPRVGIGTNLRSFYGFRIPITFLTLRNEQELHHDYQLLADDQPS